jgi:SAM-dependent methyltransferase
VNKHEPHAEPTTWHHGIVARWWAEFNTSGPEIAYFERFVRSGQPALDVACGTGRLLIPYLMAGLDVDGCDVSADMLALCKERAEREGVSARLFRQPMHLLDTGRTYRTIYVCGGFGLGSTREHDELALRRLHEHLEPDGLLVIDNEVPYSRADPWSYWTSDRRRELPQPWSEPHERRRGSDGSEYALAGRLVEVDPLAQRVVSDIRGYRWRDERLVEQDEHRLSMSVYFTNELRLLLEAAGFSVRLEADYTDAEPSPETQTVVFLARKSPEGRTEESVR